ncbi:NAD(P)(+)--arginine ADP-ribosyltransferase 2-like [Tachysurus fulvidraco]|uniref:NAD(P)(+)--arginine ADP-ribosyltransferase 2-like n=1 Tax=Tachysurus fulvidraco TaxID=1234273 RepID=UPI001FEF4ACC|nr:NAD(P)(+)--arginine ADP-ribosyltransferase 2-like [Tachysurus fulvidraco]XP_026999333.2 NAD(P)(+)--arginine ADP-ribosyltransferase 2-like [Tachysurus fulvidraco]XP_047673277.1 NAD(P)(+)--arginine ADP-ribosyltransferase 2-like [Tachysurus fulvidraco]
MRQAVFILTTTAIIIVIINTGANGLSKRKKTSALKLDMAPDSVDDQFIGCTEKISNLINKVLETELNKNKDFKNIWNKYPNITDHITRIIKVYTDPWGFHSKFNDAVSSGKKYYTKKFYYKAFHFLLTRAVQKYKVKSCVVVYRRTTVDYETPEINDVMRFGRFASTSFEEDLIKFGNKSCFKINTCLGADIGKLSEIPNEKEVLVPPYENFTITNIEKNKMNCEVLYTLKSAGPFSNMNCELLKKLY